MPQLTSLQSRLAGQIVTHARRSGWQPGHHLTEDSLLPVLGTSRTPIRAAMSWLEVNGVLEKRPNRGFFLKSLPQPHDEPDSLEPEEGSDRVYLAIAMDRLAHRLPDAVSENELIRRYDLPRTQLRVILARIAAEGWIERKPGRGWAFLPLIDTLEAYRESYRYRQMLEPAIVRAPEFRIDRAVVKRLRIQQEAVLDSGYRTLSQIELFEINSQFHEALVDMGHNRFVTQALLRINQLRRIYEYGRAFDRQRIVRVCTEHLEILASLSDGDTIEAARRLEAHLESATIEKATQLERNAPDER